MMLGYARAAGSFAEASLTFSMSKRHPRPKGRKAAAPAATPHGRPSWLPPALIACALLLAVACGVWLWRSSRETPVAGVGAGSPGASPPQAVGSASAPVTIEEFGDYQCPPCGAVYPELEKIREDYGDRVRLIYRHYPVTRLHPNALAAAHAAEAAGLQGKFWEMHGQLYRAQKSWGNSTDAAALFVSYARSLGLDAEHERATSLGVDGTPTFFVNGRQLPPDAISGRHVRAAVEGALGGKR
jgi:hypothetical protein